MRAWDTFAPDLANGQLTRGAHAVLIQALFAIVYVKLIEHQTGLAEWRNEWPDLLRVVYRACECAVGLVIGGQKA